MNPPSLVTSFVAIVSFHGSFITKLDRAYHIKCAFNESTHQVDTQLNVTFVLFSCWNLFILEWKMEPIFRVNHWPPLVNIVFWALMAIPCITWKLEISFDTNGAAPDNVRIIFKAYKHIFSQFSSSCSRLFCGRRSRDETEGNRRGWLLTGYVCHSNTAVWCKWVDSSCGRLCFPISWPVSLLGGLRKSIFRASVSFQCGIRSCTGQDENCRELSVSLQFWNQ